MLHVPTRRDVHVTQRAAVPLGRIIGAAGGGITAAPSITTPTATATVTAIIAATAPIAAAAGQIRPYRQCINRLGGTGPEVAIRHGPEGRAVVPPQHRDDLLVQVVPSGRLGGRRGGGGGGRLGRRGGRQGRGRIDEPDGCGRCEGLEGRAAVIVPTAVATAAVVAAAGADAAVVGGAAAAPGQLLGLLLLSPQDARRCRPLPGQRGESAGQVPPEGAGGGAATRPRVRGGGGGGAVHRVVQGKQADGATQRCAGSKMRQNESHRARSDPKDTTAPCSQGTVQIVLRSF